MIVHAKDMLQERQVMYYMRVRGKVLLVVHENMIW